MVINFTLKPGQVTRDGRSDDDHSRAQTQDASVGQVVNSRSVNNLPLNGRNFTFLAQLAAGVNTPQADTRGNAASGAFPANGTRPAQNNYMLDGIDNNSDTVDFLNGTNYVVLPPVEAIQEFKVQTSDFSAEFGRSGAAVLNATIKSGTNSFHGAGWEFFRNDNLDAADYFERFRQHHQKGELRQNQFGVAIGGPVIKNKIFFFGDYEGLRRRSGHDSQRLMSRPCCERGGAAGYTNFHGLDHRPNGNPNRPAGPHHACRNDSGSCNHPGCNGWQSIRFRVFATHRFVRDPFGTCPASTATFTLAGCGLNIFPLAGWIRTPSSC